MSMQSKGFTLVELIITIIVMGILSAVVLTNLNASAQHSVTIQADELRRNLSHVQFMAISQNKRLRLSVNDAGNNYTVTACINAACAVPAAVTDLATGENFSVNLKDNVTFAAANRNSILDFDSLGRPQVGAVLIAAIRTFTLSGSGNSVSVSVRPITGFAF